MDSKALPDPDTNRTSVLATRLKKMGIRSLLS